MTRYKVSNAEVPHLWAHQVQSHADGNGSLSFSGKTIYSYREPIGCLYSIPNGDAFDWNGETQYRDLTVALLNNGDYSVTTSRHQRMTRHSVSQYTCFAVSYVSFEHFNSKVWGSLRSLTELYGRKAFHVANVNAMCEDWKTESEALAKPRKVYWSTDRIDYSTTLPWEDIMAARAEHVETLLDQCNLYCRLFNVELPKLDILSAKQRIIDAFTSYHSVEKTMGRDKKEVERALRRESVRNAYNRFINGETKHRPRDLYGLSKDERRQLNHQANRVAAWQTFARFMLSESDQLPPSYLFGTEEERSILVAEDTERFRLQQEMQKKSDEEKLEAWRNGVLHSLYLRSTDGVAYCRVIGNELQTSMGVRVPLDHAKAIVRFAAACRARGVEWSRTGGNGPRVGHYTLDKVSPDGSITAGCHRIAWDEMARCASAIGWQPEADAIAAE